MRSVRIARIITRLNIGGPSIQAIELTTRLPERGHETLLVHGSLAEGEGDMRYLLDGRAPGAWELRQLAALQRTLAPGADLRAVVSVLGMLRQFKPDIVHTHMAKAGTVGRLAAVAYNLTLPPKRRARVVHTYHGHVLEGYFSAAKTRFFIGIEQALARVTDRIVAISPRIAGELVSQHGIGRPAQYRVVPLGFDLSDFARIDADARAAARATLDIPVGRLVVSTVGRLTAIKQHGLFLDAARLVRERVPHALFLIAGDGELRGELETQARAAGLTDHVRFLGWRRDLDTIYAATDVFLLTSRNEGTPVALIESMASGCAGVSTDVGGVGDVIGDTSSGRMAPFGDAAGLADATSELLLHGDTRARVGEAGRRRVLAGYGLSRLIDDIETLYHDARA